MGLSFMKRSRSSLRTTANQLEQIETHQLRFQSLEEWISLLLVLLAGIALGILRIIINSQPSSQYVIVVCGQYYENKCFEPMPGATWWTFLGFLLLTFFPSLIAARLIKDNEIGALTGILVSLVGSLLFIVVASIQILPAQGALFAAFLGGEILSLIFALFGGAFVGYIGSYFAVDE
jgi:hypothetical protein